ncbi:hypothetical protein GCM10029992_32940 [Glycomyces albus]
MGTGFDSRQLYVDGALAPRARIDLSPSDIEFDPSGFTVRNQGLGWLSGLPDQRRIEFLAHLTWTTRITPVDAIVGSTVTLRQPAWDNNTYGYDTVQHPYVGPRFFLAGSRAFLDEPGEWFLDADAGILYYKPFQGQDMANTDVELPRLETLIEVGGTYDQPVHDLHFEGLTFTGTSWLHPNSDDGYANQQTGTFLAGVQPDRPSDAFDSGSRGCYEFEGTRNHWFQMPAAVQVSAAEGVSFSGNTFANLGSIGLGIGNDANAHSCGIGLGAHDVSVVGNTFTASAGGGIAVGGVRPDAHHPSDDRMINRDILISDNSIFSTALDYLDNVAILATYATRLTVEHNYIADMPYSGIAVGYGWGANDPAGCQEYLDRGSTTSSRSTSRPRPSPTSGSSATTWSTWSTRCGTRAASMRCRRSRTARSKELLRRFRPARPVLRRRFPVLHRDRQRPDEHRRPVGPRERPRRPQHRRPHFDGELLDQSGDHRHRRRRTRQHREEPHRLLRGRAPARGRPGEGGRGPEVRHDGLKRSGGPPPCTWRGGGPPVRGRSYLVASQASW